MNTTHTSFVDDILQVLVQLGLKSLLYKLLIQDHGHGKDMAIIPPLFLRTMYPLSVLENINRFEICSAVEKKSVEHNHPSKESGRCILPLPKDAKPSHGTTEELFEHGCAGLV